MKAWPEDLPVGMLGDLQARFSSRGKFTFLTRILGLSEVCTHNHSHNNINNDNDDKTVHIENIVKLDNATENSVEVEELFEDDEN